MDKEISISFGTRKGMYFEIVAANNLDILINDSAVKQVCSNSRWIYLELKVKMNRMKFLKSKATGNYYLNRHISYKKGNLTPSDE